MAPPSGPAGLSFERAEARRFLCSYCGDEQWTGEVYRLGTPSSDRSAHLLLCPTCGNVTFMDRAGRLYPGAGEETLHDLPEPVGRLYGEMRAAGEADAPGAVLLLAGQFFDHLARQQGASDEEIRRGGLWFLEDRGHLPAYTRPWIDEIVQIQGQFWEVGPGAVKEAAGAARILAEMAIRRLYTYPARLEGLKAG